MNISSLKYSISNNELSNKSIVGKISDSIFNKNFSKNTINKYNFLNRIKYYKYIISKLKNINVLNCLENKTFKTSNGKTYDGYTLNNIVNLEKQMGSKSNYGVIYLTSVKDAVRRFPIASKLMEKNTENTIEKDINTIVTDKILLNKLSKHFIYTYKTILCNNLGINVPDIIKNTKYYISLTELANGDLKELCNKKEFLSNDELVYNVLIQVILSICTFHNIGYSHGDCHWGNFLYHHNEDIGYYHYKINNIDYYLKSCKYNIMIYDFGFAKKIKKLNIKKNILKDYLRIINAFYNNKIESSWIKIDNLPSKKLSNYSISLFESIVDVLKKNIKVLNYIDFINNVVLPSLITIPNNIFSKIKPKNKIINIKPFIISQELKM